MSEPMDADAVLELLSLHLDKRLQLAFGASLGSLTPRAAHAQDPVGTVTALLQLAYVGASLEQIAKEQPDLSTRSAVMIALRHWRRELQERA